MKAIWFIGNIETTLILHYYLKEADEVVFIDHGRWPQEVYSYLSEAEKFFGFYAKRLDVELQDPEEPRDWCIYLRKEFLLPYLESKSFRFVYEPLRKAQPLGTGVEERFPLAGMSDYEIWLKIREKGLPFCSLYLKGFKRVSCAPRVKAGEGGDYSSRLSSMGYL